MAANKLHARCALCGGTVEPGEGLTQPVDDQWSIVHLPGDCERTDAQRYLLSADERDADPAWQLGLTVHGPRGWVTILRSHRVEHPRTGARTVAYWVRTAGPLEIAAAQLLDVEVTL
ncbi:hypothetical protein GXB85_13455 [Cellulomonas sp. APG4]|uniref:hypothetical protein n=1 Tax=Cellulomonas sp. APG4 TaxID=1538656 RepID=UPI0013799275|nr:hypothetical protein [Cellulomonas sp. APG4]NCT91948.1 hypothetical protein [Cellulomonas sp. APG4]